MKRKIPKLERQMNEYESFTNLVKRHGFSLKNQILKTETLNINNYYHKYLHFPVGEPLFHMKRLRIVENIPVMLENIYVPMELVQGIFREKLGTADFHQLLERQYQLMVNQTIEELLIAYVLPEEAGIFGLDREEQVVVIKGTAKRQDGLVFEYFEHTALPELFIFRE